MRLLTRIALTDPPKLQAAARLYRLGRCQLRKADAWTVLASVRRPGRNSVTLRRSPDDTVSASCTCGGWRHHRHGCVHIWTALYAASEAKHLGGASGAPVTNIYPDPEVSLHDEDLDDVFEDDGDDADEYDDEYDDDDDIDEDVRTATWRHGTSSPRRPVAAKREPSWRDKLGVLAEGGASTAMAAATAELLYVVDEADSRAYGQLAILILARERNLRGEWGKPRQRTIAAKDIATFPDPRDREILSLLGGGRQGYQSNYRYLDMDTISSPSLPRGPAQPMLLKLMVATGRCRLKAESAAELEALAWDDGEPWRIHVELRPGDNGHDHVLAGFLCRGVERMELGAASVLADGGLVIAAGRISGLDTRGLSWAKRLRPSGRLELRGAEPGPLLEALLALPDRPTLDLPPEMAFSEVCSEPRRQLRLKGPAGVYAAHVGVVGEVSFVYGDTVFGESDANAGSYDAATRQWTKRDVDAEASALAELPAIGFKALRGYQLRFGLRAIPAKRVPQAVRALMERGWRVEAEGKLYRAAGAVRLEVKSEVDWFDLRGKADFEGVAVELPALLKSLHRGDNLVPLADGSFGLLPAAWLKKVGLVLEAGEVDGERVRFRRDQAALLDALLLAEPEASCDESFAHLRRELNRFDGVTPGAVAKSFIGELRPYQREGLGWLWFLRRFGLGGCLADDMGLGKTVQVLAFLDALRAARVRGEEPPAIGPALAVVPRSLVFHWINEARRFAPELRVVDLATPGRVIDRGQLERHDLVVTTYGLLRRDIAALREVDFDLCILDEAQAIKNATTDTAKAARLVRARHRMAMSGTPIENHLGELWSLFEFLNPGFLGKAAVFKRFAGKGSGLDDEGRRLLARAVKPFILRRTKEQVAPELPEKLEQTLACELEPDQRKLYDELRRHYQRALLGAVDKKGIAKAKIQVLEALLRLRQAACHPGLIDRKFAAAPSAKLDALVPRLVEVVEEGHKALVFSQFTSFLDLLKARLDPVGLGYEYLDGKTRDREARVQHFQTDANCRLFLISLKAGGLGLNLTAADYVFLLDPWWNPAVEAQAIDRTHRIGQTRRVFAYRLIARDTIEEKILELQRSKRALTEAIIGADESLLQSLTREDLELLLSE